MSYRKILLAGGLLLALVAFFALDLAQYLRLQALQEGHAALQALHAQHPVRVALVYGALYVVATALSVPGAVVLTLAGGALLGLWWGTLVVSVASTLGATLAMLAARYLLRDAVEARFRERLAEVNAGIAREGALYLLTLRLLPVIPFFVVNLLMGLTRMRTWTFLWVSQVGMLAATLVYVNAGTQLARLTSVRDILSPGLLGSLALLAALPWVTRHALAHWRTQRPLARWRHERPRRFDRNLIVIGAGAGGLVSAYVAAAVRARVTLIEAHKMGGDCLNYGCVPSKALIRSAKVAQLVRQAGHYGLSAGTPVADFRAVMQRIRAVIHAIEPHDSVERYTALGVDVRHGHGRLVNPWTVEITAADGTQERLTARSIVIAAGAEPAVPDLPGLPDSGYLTSDTLWDRLAHYDAPPGHVVVLGGGSIGCELAQALARLGSKVTVVEHQPRLLAREDEDVSHAVALALQADGVRLHLGSQALRCASRDRATGPSPRELVVQGPDGTLQHLPFDEIICAVGRRARLSGYGLENLGLDTGRTLSTNEYLQTLYPHIYAVGDVTGPWQLTHVAAHQAWYATVNALFGSVRRFKADYRVVPRCTFTDPEVARVGLNEITARAQGVALEVTRFDLNDLDRQICDAGPAPGGHGFIKVLTPPGSDRILGATIVGPHAGELLAEYTLAMKHGLGLGKILATVHPYPTLSEASKYTAGAWRRAHAPHRLLAWAARWHAWRRG